MTAAHSRRLVFQPDCRRAIQSGIHQMVTPIGATLGPLARHVLCENVHRTTTPEILENGGIIARRIVQLEDPHADMGAMMVRHLVSRLHQTTGDSTATAAVLFQAVYDEGLKYVEAGANAMLLQQQLEVELKIILDALSSMVVLVEGKERLARLAESICHDPPVARLLGEIFDIIGEYGQLEVRVGSGRGVEREYVEGAYWSGGVLSRELLANAHTQRVDLVRPAILLTDLEIHEPRQLEAVMSASVDGGFTSLVIVALKVSDSVIGFLVANREKYPIIAVKTPGGNLNRVQALEDVAALVGGRLFLNAAGDTLQKVNAEDFGTARRAWADRDYFGVTGGGGNPRMFRQHIANLRVAFSLADDPKAGEALQERIGRLMGGSATLRVGGFSELEAKTRKLLAERVANALRGAVRVGVLPGGGAGLLACQPLLEKRLNEVKTLEARAACRILLSALEAPLRTIAANAGFDASVVVANVKRAKRGYGFDVCSGAMVPMVEAGIADVASGYRAAVQAAVSSAAQALTVDVLVHRRTPEQVLDPG
jgi:chaperonin GroEL